LKYDTVAYEKLKQDLRIDRDALDEECITQPHSYFHASEAHVLALSRRDQLKHGLEVTVAELDKDIRDAMAANGEKMTEALVKAQITREQDYQRAHQNYLNSCLEADKWEALKNAYRGRADMLKSLVGLFQSGYFGEVTGSAERREARERVSNKR